MPGFTNIRVERGIGPNSQFARDLARVAGAEAARELVKVAADAERRTNDIVLAELVAARWGDRHRPGPHLLGSFRATVEADPAGFPILIKMRSIAPSRTVNAQESGAKAHTITGPSVFPVGDQSTGPVSKKRRPAYGKQRYQNAKGTPGRSVKASNIKHPGNRAIHMMKRGLEGAVQAAYHQSVTAAKVASYLRG